MPPKKKTAKKSTCICGGDCRNNHPHLPGLLLTAFGLIALPLNFDMIPGFEWARAWPLLVVLSGLVMVVRVYICNSKS